MAKIVHFETFDNDHKSRIIIISTSYILAMNLGRFGCRNLKFWLRIFLMSLTESAFHEKTEVRQSLLLDTQEAQKPVLHLILKKSSSLLRGVLQRGSFVLQSRSWWCELAKNGPIVPLYRSIIKRILTVYAFSLSLLIDKKLCKNCKRK